jgi:hypothetical protein
LLGPTWAGLAPADRASFLAPSPICGYARRRYRAHHIFRRRVYHPQGNTALTRLRLRPTRDDDLINAGFPPNRLADIDRHPFFVFGECRIFCPNLSAAIVVARAPRFPGLRSRLALPSPGNIRAASCAAAIRRASFTRSPSPTGASGRGTKADRDQPGGERGVANPCDNATPGISNSRFPYRGRSTATPAYGATH